MGSMENGNSTATQDHQDSVSVQEKTFTQDEVNRIVQERLSRVKIPQGPSEKELELQRRESDLYIREQIMNNKLPDELYDSLKGLDKETADKCLNIIIPYVKKSYEPVLNPVLPTGGVGDNDNAIRRAMGLLKR